MRNWLNKNFALLLISAFVLIFIAASQYDNADRRYEVPYRFAADTLTGTSDNSATFTYPYVFEDGNYYYSVQIEHNELTDNASSTYTVQTSNAAAGSEWYTIQTLASQTADNDTVFSGQFYAARLRIQHTKSDTADVEANISVKFTEIQ